MGCRLLQEEGGGVRWKELERRERANPGMVFPLQLGRVGGGGGG